MKLAVLFAVGFAIAGCSAGDAQDIGDWDLARMLAGDSTRQAAVGKILASGLREVPLLLSWAESPPPSIDSYQLNIGLADAFGRLRAKEAIPFLIKNISIDRVGLPDMWLRAPEVIEARLAAVAALEQIGPDALDALLKANAGPLVWQDRAALIFTVSRMKDPRAGAFLRSVLGELNWERNWAEEGIRLIEQAR